MEGATISAIPQFTWKERAFLSAVASFVAKGDIEFIGKTTKNFAHDLIYYEMQFICKVIDLGV